MSIGSNSRPAEVVAVRVSPIREPRLHRLVRRARDRRDRRHQGFDEHGLSLVELLVAFAALIVLLTLVGTTLTTYVTAGTNVISSYQATDQLLPSSMIIQRLIRSEVEPAPTVANTCSGAGIPCPPFLTGSVGTYTTTFYANVGDPDGPAMVVMAASTPVKCASCKFYSSTFTVTQYAACPNPPANNVLAGCTSSTPACPFTTISTAVCTWSTSGKVLVDVNGVVNGTNQTYLTSAAPPTIFTYNTLDPYSRAYVAGAGGTPNASGILPTFNSCAAPTLTNGNPSSSNCPPDMIQSVGVDLQVDVPGTPVQENSFVVYRLSSASFLYSPLVG